jgi:hypothetical protein
MLLLPLQSLQLQKRLRQQTLPLLQHSLRILLERIPILLRRSGLMLVVELQGIGLLPRQVRSAMAIQKR